MPKKSKKWDAVLEAFWSQKGAQNGAKMEPKTKPKTTQNLEAVLGGKKANVVGYGRTWCGMREANLY